MAYSLTAYGVVGDMIASENRFWVTETNISTGFVDSLTPSESMSSGVKQSAVFGGLGWNWGVRHSKASSVPGRHDLPGATVLNGF